MQRFPRILLLMLALFTGISACEKKAPEQTTSPPAQPAPPTAVVSPSDAQIADAYLYLLGRLLVLRQQRLDFEREGFAWNKLIHREPGGVAWANPNLDVAYSEAWVAVDERSCVQLDIPKIKGRYYTWHMLNGWGETVLNINERAFPQQPSGRYALCLQGSAASVPAGALRVDLPAKTTRVLARIELGADPKEAVRLQRQFKLTPLGEPIIDAPIEAPLFSNDQLPRAEAFDLAEAILQGEADLNPGMETVRKQVLNAAALVKSGPQGRARVDRVIEQVAWPELRQRLAEPGPGQNGWRRPEAIGNYGSDFGMRTVANFSGIWANSADEAVYFANTGLDGGATYRQNFPAAALPKTKAHYFWSVIAVDAKDFRVTSNPLKRYLLNNRSPLKYNADGSLTLVFAPAQPKEVPKGNWLPTPAGTHYNLTFRFYGPSGDVAGGHYFPPPLEQQN